MLYFLHMEQDISYNRFLFEKRKETGLSRRKYAKSIGISPFVYSLIEKGYVKPGRKEIQKFSEFYQSDFSVYLEGIHSYPEETEKNEPMRWIRNLLSKTWLRLTIIFLTVLSLGGTITGYTLSDYYRNHARSFYSQRYLSFVDAVREKGDYTLSLLHEMDRPCIHKNNDNLSASILVSKEDESLRVINAYLTFKEDNTSLLYYFGKETNSYLLSLKVSYTDYDMGIKYTSSFTYKDRFVLDGYISTNTDKYYTEGDADYAKLESILSSHLDDLDKEWTTLIQEKTGLNYDFYKGILVDQQIGGKKHFKAEIISLILSVTGVILTGVFLFAFIYSFLEGKNRKEVVLFHNSTEIANDSKNDTEVTKSFHPVKKDIIFTPFLPETFFEIVGILLTFFGSLRLIYYLFSFFSSEALNPNEFTTMPKLLFMFFTVGMFLLYFIDFDIFLEDRRSVRNIFLYGITFFALYALEVTLIEYLSRTRGIVQLLTSYYMVPNNFGTIACYFLIMFFLFMTPTWANSKKKVVFFRLLSILPIGWIIASTVIVQGYQSWGLKLNNWVLYLFNSERPQFSLLCVTYLVGLYFLRLFFEHRYGKNNAKRFFNSNRFYFLKNSLICLIIALLSLTEYLTRNLGGNTRAIGGYWEIIFLIPFLFFYHPHFGKRNMAVDYLTLILYFAFFGVGYLIVGFISAVIILGL